MRPGGAAREGVDDLDVDLGDLVPSSRQIDSVAVTLRRAAGSFDPPTRGQAGLVIVRGTPLGQAILLAGEVTVIGRSSDCDIRPECDRVSRRHAEIRRRDDEWLVKDLGSTNGILVNGVATRAAELRAGDTLQVGRMVLRFLAGPDFRGLHLAELDRLVTFDDLTEMLTRRAFDTFVAEEWNRARRYERSLAAAILRIDGFDEIRVAAGRGPAVLRHVVAEVCRLARKMDVIARYDAATFAICLPELGMAPALELAEKLRAAVAAAPCEFAGARVHLTISAGVAALSDEVEGPESLLALAEARAAAAAAAGGDRVAVKQ